MKKHILFITLACLILSTHSVAQGMCQRTLLLRSLNYPAAQSNPRFNWKYFKQNKGELPPIPRKRIEEIIISLEEEYGDSLFPDQYVFSTYEKGEWKSSTLEKDLVLPGLSLGNIFLGVPFPKKHPKHMESALIHEWGHIFFGFNMMSTSYKEDVASDLVDAFTKARKEYVRSGLQIPNEYFDFFTLQKRLRQAEIKFRESLRETKSVSLADIDDVLDFFRNAKEKPNILSIHLNSTTTPEVKNIVSEHARQFSNDYQEAKKWERKFKERSTVANLIFEPEEIAEYIILFMEEFTADVFVVLKDKDLDAVYKALPGKPSRSFTHRARRKTPTYNRYHDMVGRTRAWLGKRIKKNPALTKDPKKFIIAIRDAIYEELRAWLKRNPYQMTAKQINETFIAALEKEFTKIEMQHKVQLKEKRLQKFKQTFGL